MNIYISCHNLQSLPKFLIALSKIAFHSLSCYMITSLCFLWIAKPVSAQTVKTVVDYVQPMSGTAASTTSSALKHSGGTERFANTIPAVTLPFAMTQWTPQTQFTEKKCLAPYMYRDSLFSGFRGSHWISGSCTQDYGSFTIMPLTGSLSTARWDYPTSFSHDDEVSNPHYYRVKLPAYSLTAEITATLRCAMMQFTATKNDTLNILVSPNSDQGKAFVKIDIERGEIVGYNPVFRIYQGWGQPAGFNGYFVIRFEKKFASHGTFAGAERMTSDTISNKKDIGAFVAFAMKAGEQLRVSAGTSFTGIESARKNLDEELSGWDFNATVAKNRSLWETALSQVKVKTQNEKDKRIFYTAMYHAMQHPRLFNDVNGSYPSFAGNMKVEKTTGSYYDDFSMWDIYRAQLPLFELLKPDMVNDFVRSMIAKGQQGRWLPIFPCWNSYTSAMIGDHSTAFIASAYVKGIRNYDVPEVYRLMRKNAYEIPSKADYLNGMGRRALDSWLKYGYIPMEDSVPDAFHKKEQVSRTLEYAYDDYALSVVAKGLGKTADYKELRKRGFNYRNVFDKSVGLMRGRFENGSWYHPFNPDKKEPYITEGTPRQYTFYVPHDVNGLAKLMGGKRKLEQALDSLFLNDEYWHGNEPGHQIPFMYNYTPAPWKTQREVRKILAEEYSDGPGGLSGNDDAGQMSAWYVFAALGFYPLNPVSDEYMLSSPLFDEAVITLPGNKTFTIVVHKTSETAVYIRQVKWNDRPWTKNFLLHSKMKQGGKLEIWLSDQHP